MSAPFAHSTQWPEVWEAAGAWHDVFGIEPYGVVEGGKGRGADCLRVRDASVGLFDQGEECVDEVLCCMRVGIEEQRRLDQFEFHDDRAPAGGHQIHPRVCRRRRSNSECCLGKSDLIGGCSMRLDSATVVILNPVVAWSGYLPDSMTQTTTSEHQ